MLSRLFRKRKPGEDSEWQLPTSMIDVVFLLLIFFLCASKFRQLERRLDAFLPDNGPDIVYPPPPVREEIPIRVSASGVDLEVPRYQVERWVTHDPNELAARLRRLPDGDYRIVIDSRQNVPFYHVMSAVDACARAELNNVSFRPPPARS
jgi:biopolymer transport protein ExbD